MLSVYQELGQFWLMSIGADSDGSIPLALQGVSVSEKDLAALMEGRWHEVNWIDIALLLDLKVNGVKPDGDESYFQYAMLCQVRRVVVSTTELLGISVENDRSSLSPFGMMSRVIKLERRSRALPKGSEVRKKSELNFVEVFKEMMREAGERWLTQWAAPVNFSEPLQKSFLDSKCFVLNTFDRLEKVADQLFEYEETLPCVFGNDAWDKPREDKLQKPNPPQTVPQGPDSGNQSCEVA